MCVSNGGLQHGGVPVDEPRFRRCPHVTQVLAPMSLPHVIPLTVVKNGDIGPLLSCSPQSAN